MKKILALILALVMALSLVACGEKQPDEPVVEDTSIVLQEGNEYGAPAGRILVMYWSTYGSSTAEFVDKIIDEFNNMQEEYWVVREYNGGYYDQIAKLMATEQKDLPAFEALMKQHIERSKECCLAALAARKQNRELNS